MTSGLPSPPSQFSRTLRECRDLYVASGQLCALEYPNLISKNGDEFIQLMDDLHRALVLKIYFTVSEADRQWSKDERFLAEVLFHHLWDTWLSGDDLKDAAKQASEQSHKLKWYALVRPFDRIAPLREKVGRLETLVLRLANLVARADGRLHEREAATIRTIQEEISQHLRSIPIDRADQHEDADEAAPNAIEKIIHNRKKILAATKPSSKGVATATEPTLRHQIEIEEEIAGEEPEEPKITLEDALAELDRLIGLERIKHEVRTLTNFLNLQRRRKEAGLAETDVSLHMVFNGNPGTGKTTVARIIGKIYGAMGVLKNGHLVETDRSGLVAEYAGQTGPKTNGKIDEAMGGVLFIDEAYSLIAEGEDPFGREAVQALLKRAEDDRDNLVVILAGYPNEMETLLKSNPGLSSRFGRQLTFDDYEPLELVGIFGLMCRKNEYKLTSEARLELIQGMTWLFKNRDRHFGNGRAARNQFENAVRRLANRIADIEELTPEQLSLLTEDDILFAKVPKTAFERDDDLRIHIECPECDHAKDVPPEYLGRSLTCPKCGEEFIGDWGTLMVTEE